MSMFWEVTVSVILSKKLYMYICPVPNGFWDRAISLYRCKIVDKEILCIFSSIGIYCTSDKVGTVYLVQYIFKNSTINISSGTTIAEAINVQNMSLFSICEDMRCFAQHSYNAIINSHSCQLTLPTDSHASYSGAVRQEWRTVLGAKSKLLYSETSLSRKQFRDRTHVHIHIFA